MRIWLLYPYTTPRTNNAFSWFQKAFANHGMDLEVYFWGEDSLLKSQLRSLDGSVMTLNRKDKPDGAVIRGYNSGLSMWFEMKGIKVVNPCLGMENCRDKITTSAILQQRGIPTPRTLCYGEGLHSNPSYKELQKDFDGLPFVMKLAFGSKGEDVYLIEGEAQYLHALERWRETASERMSFFKSRGGLWTGYGCWEEEVEHGCTLLFQQYIAGSHGRDLRVWVVGNRVAGHLLRYSATGFTSNFAQGGSASPYSLPEEGAEIAIAASKALGLDFAGVDLLFDDPFSVCEVNGNAGFRTSSLVGGMDIPEIIAREFLL